jgi:Mg-chelatase subunit ChlD
MADLAGVTGTAGPNLAAQVSYTVDGTTVGVEHVWPLAVLPVAVVVLAVLVLRGDAGPRTASRRSRRLLFASRVLVVTLLVVGAMGPYTVGTRETPGDPRVTLLTDESASVDPYRNVTGELVAAIEEEGVPVTTATIAAGTDSRVGDGLVANLRENGTVVVVTDGQVTGGRSLAAAGEAARDLNATVNVVDVPVDRAESAVSVAAPDTVSVGIETELAVSVTGVGDPGAVPVTVTVDGEEVRTGTLAPGETLTVRQTFNETGPHRVTARTGADDVHARNDVFYRTVEVVERPDLLYVSNGEFPLRGYLESLYNVTTAPRVPDDLDPYQAVVLQNVPASGVGNTSALQADVVDGGGLVVVGGEDAYEAGGYAESPLASLLPVRVGNATGGTVNVVLLVDISGSAAEGLATQKGVALDVLSQLGDTNRVGLVAFDNEAFRVAPLRPLSESRETVADRIRRLEVGGGGTHIDVGLLGARDLLGDRDGTVILLSDGLDDTDRAAAAASQLGTQGVRVITVGVGDSVDASTLEQVAEASGGTYFAADETDRLELLFGAGASDFESRNLTVVERTFVTSGVELTADPGEANRVAVKAGADYQVATGDGTPAITSWRFGLGRVVAVTTYGPDGGLDGLLEEPDSLVVTRSVNYAVGDPREDPTGVTAVADARVGRPTTLTYRGSTRPEAAEVTFRRVGPETFRGEFTPAAAGFREVLGTTYAVNYPLEYGRLGTSPVLSKLVASTGGRAFTPDEGAEIARLARDRATRPRTVRDRWGWAALLAAVVVFAVEVLARRVQVYRGRTSRESGLP